jgi:hypothetical protein
VIPLKPFGLHPDGLSDVVKLLRIVGNVTPHVTPRFPPKLAVRVLDRIVHVNCHVITIITYSGLTHMMPNSVRQQNVPVLELIVSRMRELPLERGRPSLTLSESRFV